MAAGSPDGCGGEVQRQVREESGQDCGAVQVEEVNGSQQLQPVERPRACAATRCVCGRAARMERNRPVCFLRVEQDVDRGSRGRRCPHVWHAAAVRQGVRQDQRQDGEEAREEGPGLLPYHHFRRPHHRKAGRRREAQGRQGVRDRRDRVGYHGRASLRHVVGHHRQQGGRPRLLGQKDGLSARLCELQRNRRRLHVGGPRLNQ
mmetsp:Transcript_27471/g.88689  ORF Transcript_27471/g.88689 Transcript_27471/m.88689 type:complete len:204 (+) Transcript_27471:387-998(+)